MVDDIRLESDEGHWTLVLDDVNGTHVFPVDPQMVDDALNPWRMHELEGEAARREMERLTWDPWKSAAEAYSCHDPEGDFVEMLREQGDALKTRRKEQG